MSSIGSVLTIRAPGDAQQRAAVNTVAAGQTPSSHCLSPVRGRRAPRYSSDRRVAAARKGAPLAQKADQAWPASLRPGQRISVVGTTGCGKTWLARRLADLLDCPHVELDALHWGANWTPRSREQFRQLVVKALAGQRWTADGNYGSKVRDLVWEHADMVVWLDYSLPIILWRLTRRTLARVLTREELWNGNRETWQGHLGRDSLFLWATSTFHRRRQEYLAAMANPGYARLVFVRLRSPRQTRRWLATIQQQLVG